MYVGPEITRAVGKPVVSLFRAVPATFLLVCLGGIVVGVVVLTYKEPQAKYPVVLGDVLGLGTIAFYTGCLVLCVVKLVRGTWTQFCNWWLGVLESL